MSMLYFQLSWNLTELLEFVAFHVLFKNLFYFWKFYRRKNRTLGNVFYYWFSGYHSVPSSPRVQSKLNVSLTSPKPLRHRGNYMLVFWIENSFNCFVIGYLLCFNMNIILGSMDQIPPGNYLNIIWQSHWDLS